jgi:hypothetical protein
MVDLLVERDRYKGEADRLRNQYTDEIARLRKELRDAQESLTDMSKSKGAEVSAMVGRFNSEKAELERLLQGKMNDMISLQAKMDQILSDNMRKDEV